MMAKHIHVKVTMPNADETQREAAKTARLRAVRLAKEAADRDAAKREIAMTPPKSRRPRPLNQPSSRVS
jgi:hypothetical protein